MAPLLSTQTAASAKDTASVANLDVAEMYSRVSEELRTQDGSKIHRELREAPSGTGRLQALLKLHAISEVAPRGPGRLEKSAAAAQEWLLREADASSDSERLAMLNLAVMFAPTSNSGHKDREQGDHGEALTEALVKRQHVLHGCGTHSDRADNEAFLRQVLETLPESTRRKYDRDLSVVLGDENTTASAEQNASKVRLPKIYGGLHYKIKRTSALVNVEYKEGRGRCLVANEDIPPGSVLITDSPYAWALSSDRWPTHCQTCCRRTLAPVPCTRCAAVVFCSVPCRQAGWQRFHASECAVLEHLRGPSLTPLPLMVARTLLAAGLDRVKPYLERADTYEVNSVDNAAIYDAHDYDTVFNQIPHNERWNIMDAIRRGTLAMFLLRWLQLTDFGVAQLSEHQQLQLASLLLRHLDSCSCNGFQLSELCEQEEPAEGEDDEPLAVTLGGAVSTTVSLLNHSCDPNVTRVNHGRHLIVVNTRTLRAGEELLDNYCTLFHETQRARRQTMLEERYHFRCQCVACTYHWPLYDRMLSTLPRAQVRDLLDTAGTYEADGQHKSAAQTFALAAQLVEQEYPDRDQPCKLLVDCQGFLTRSLWLAYRL